MLIIYEGGRVKNMSFQVGLTRNSRFDCLPVGLLLSVRLLIESSQVRIHVKNCAESRQWVDVILAELIHVN